MKMTEKMKQSLMEDMRKEGIELSDKELDEVAGGRSLTSVELFWAGHADDRRHYRMGYGYLQYIESLPEGSPEVDWFDYLRMDLPITYTCQHCGATVTASSYKDYPTCCGCGKKIDDSEAAVSFKDKLEKLWR